MNHKIAMEGEEKTMVYPEIVKIVTMKVILILKETGKRMMMEHAINQQSRVINKPG